MENRAQIFTFQESGRLTPLLVSVPHSGLIVPEREKVLLQITQKCLQQDADLFVDYLYANAPKRGASLLAARVSRYVIDLNRAIDDVDTNSVPTHPAPRPELPRGLIWSISGNGRSVLSRPLTFEEYQERVKRYYTPYREKLRQELQKRKKMFGYAILLDGHSMPSHYRMKQRNPRADVVPGVRGGTSCHRDLLDFVVSHFKEAGLSVAVDKPYQGGNITAEYGCPEKSFHAMQIELNRALYMDEKRFLLKESGFQALRAILDDLIERVHTLRL